MPGGRCGVATCHRNAGKVCQVGGMMFPPVAEMPEKCARWTLCCFHLSQKCRKSVPGGRYAASTCHGNAAKVWQVDGVMLHLSRKCGESVPGGRCNRRSGTSGQKHSIFEPSGQKHYIFETSDREIACLELPTENCWPRHPGPIITDGTGLEDGEWCRCLKH